MNIKKELLPVILIILAVLLVVLVIMILVNAARNKKVMQETIDKGMERLSAYYTVVPRDPGSYQVLKFYGVMRFHVDQYEVQQFGNLSVLTADMGFMQMVSFMITPFEKAVPLCTMDFMYIMGNRKSYVEFYNLVGDTQTTEYQQVLAKLSEMVSRNSDIPELEVEEAWYDNLLTVSMHKQLKSKEDAQNQALFCDALTSYLEASKDVAPSTAANAGKQLENTKEYSDALIDKGGVSTDVFKKALGEEQTREFFDQVFFGTNYYRAE